jgi:hypothetical protein
MGEGLFLPRVLDFDVGPDATGVKNPPLHRRTDRPELAGAGKPFAGADTLESGHARKREFGEEIRGGDPDLRGGGGQLPFGFLNVRTAQ